MVDASADVSTTHLQRLLDQLAAGDQHATSELIQLTRVRLHRLARRILTDIPQVRTWEESDDLVQNAAVRLWRALANHKPPTPLDFYRLAAALMRRELMDLSRHYFGPCGHGANLRLTNHGDHHSPSATPPECQHADGTNDPQKLSRWADFHEYIETLSDDERALFDVLWYQGLNIAQGAAALQLSERTLRRRWKEARLKLYREVLSAEEPASMRLESADEPN